MISKQPGSRITPCRPMTIESVASKNPVTHVGMLYNYVCYFITVAIVKWVPDAE